MEHASKKLLHADSQILLKIVVNACYLLMIHGYSILFPALSHAQTIGTAPIRRMSGAPIGDTSIMIYPAGGMLPGQSMTLKHPLLQDSVRISGVTGTPSYVHLYRVDALPNVTCGLPSAASNRYFGVFTDPPSIQYNISYYYGGNAVFTPLVEPLMAMYFRNTNADITCAAWNNAGATFYPIGDSVRRVTFTGRKEFILDHLQLTALPVELSSMTIEWLDESSNTAMIKWSTESAENISSFIVEKSTDANQWTTIHTLLSTGNQGENSQYSVIDTTAMQPVNYYRLKLTDNDGNSRVFPIQSLTRKQISNQPAVFPNPATDHINLYFNEKLHNQAMIELRNETGQVVLAFSIDPQEMGSSIGVDIGDLSKGIYFLSLTEMSPQQTSELNIILPTKIVLFH